MDVIELRGMVFYGFHGALPEERTLGQRFGVDVRLGLNLQPAGRGDDLRATVNYADVAKTVRTVVEGRPFNLIEALAEAIATAVLSQYPATGEVSVRVVKPSAPVPAASTAEVAVEIRRGRELVVPPERQHGAEPRSSAGRSTSAETSGGSVLSAATIRRLIDSDVPLVDRLTDPDVQIQPNGVDLTLESVWRLEGVGGIGVSDADRAIPTRGPVSPDADGWFVLAPGTYIIRLHESVAIPTDLMAFGRPRSSVLRCGAALHTAVWDAGYRGRSESLLVVYAERGIRLQYGARLLQLVFVRLDAETGSYAGTYQGENIGPPVDEPIQTPVP